MIKSALGDAQFAPEVLSRIDEVFAFRPFAGSTSRVSSRWRSKGSCTNTGSRSRTAASIRHPARCDRPLRGHRTGGVRDMTRAIERQITDGVIDAKTQGAKTIRLRAEGAVVRAEIAQMMPQRPASADAALAPA